MAELTVAPATECVGPGTLGKLSSDSRALQDRAWVATSKGLVSRLVLDHLDAAVARVLRELRVTIGSTCRLIDVIALEDGEEFQPSFSFILQSEIGRVLVDLDGPFCRALIDPITLSLSGLRGAGEPSDVECGVLEYLALDLLDRLDVGVTTEATVESFCSNFGDEDARGLRASGIPIRLNAGVGGRLGQVVVHLPSVEVGGPTAFFPASCIKNKYAGGVQLALQFAEMSLFQEELDCLQPGALIVLDHRDINVLLGSGRLVTDTGWALGRLLTIDDQPTHVQVLLGDANHEPNSPRPRGVEGPWLRLFIGCLTAERSSVEGWKRGTSIALAKDCRSPVRALTSKGQEFSGEIVRLSEQNLAIRIVERLVE